MNQQSWRKGMAQAFPAGMKAITSEQRIAVQELAEQVAKAPYSELLKPILHINGDREIEVSGVWLRYRIDDSTKTVVFLAITK